MGRQFLAFLGPFFAALCREVPVCAGSHGLSRFVSAHPPGPLFKLYELSCGLMLAFSLLTTPPSRIPPQLFLLPGQRVVITNNCIEFSAFIQEGLRVGQEACGLNSSRAIQLCFSESLEYISATLWNESSRIWWTFSSPICSVGFALRLRHSHSL